MKIGIDIRTLIDKQYSGVSLHTLNLIRAILAIDKDNQYKLFYNSFSDFSHRIQFPNENIQIIKTSYPNKVFNFGLQKLLKFPKIDKVLGGVDVFWSPHINFTNLSDSCRKILTIHDLSFLRYPEYFDIKKNFWHWAINAKKLIRNADKVIAISENTRNDVIEMCGIPEERIEIIYPGIEEKYFSIPGLDEIDYVKNKYDLPNEYIFYLGNLEPRKNIPTLIKAFELIKKDFPDLNLVLAGGMGWKAGRILKAIAESKSKKYIKLIDYVEEGDKRALYRMAKIFVYPSFYEGFGLPPLEAMACGAPVISSNSSSLNETLGLSALTIDPNNHSELARGIKLMLKNEKLRKKFSESGRITALNFSWSKSAERYMKIIRHLY